MDIPDPTPVIAEKLHHVWHELLTGDPWRICFAVGVVIAVVVARNGDIPRIIRACKGKKKED